MALVAAGLLCSAASEGAPQSAPTESWIGEKATGPQYAARCDATLRLLADPSVAAAAAGRLAAANALYLNVHPKLAVREAARACQARLERQRATLPGDGLAAGGTDARAANRYRRALSTLERDFERRLTERTPRLRFAAAEVDGLAPPLLEAWRVNGTTDVEVGVGQAHYYPFMRQVDSERARRRMYLAHANRGDSRTSRRCNA